MATNVRPEELNYDWYATKKFDDNVENVNPGWGELHDHIDRLVHRDFAGRQSVKALELGVGTGLTAQKILQKFASTQYTSVQYTAIDFSETMLTGARERLTEYDIEFIQGDYAGIDLPQDNDLVISVIGIHHQETDQDKMDLFQKIADATREGGAFIFGDLVTFRDPHEAALQEALHYHYLVEHVKDPKLLQEWTHHHKFLNKLAPLEAQVEWLQEAGFREVNVAYQKFQTALMYARK
jgi:tRNA (cmo5U34)-methyltransferase